MHGITDAPVEAPKLADAGFSAVVVYSSVDAATVSEAGMEAWLCGSGFPLIRDDDAIKAMGVDGRAYVWFNSASPCAPEVREASLEAYRRMVGADEVTGILIDGCRFASPASGEAFFTDFSPHARSRAAQLGMDIDLMKRDLPRLRAALRGLAASPHPAPGASLHPGTTAAVARLVEALLDYPGVLEWLRFRRAHVTDHFAAIAEIVHAAGKRCGAYVFTPSLAPLVGQCYADLAGIMDIVSPMIYRSYPHAPGIAALNHEVAALVEALVPGEAAGRTTGEGPAAHPGQPREPDASAVAAQAFITALLGTLGHGGFAARPAAAAIRAGLAVEIVGTECARARAALGYDVGLVPIIQIDDPELRTAEREVERAGADGIDYFVFNEQWQRQLTGKGSP